MYETFSTERQGEIYNWSVSPSLAKSSHILTYGQLDSNPILGYWLS